MHKRNVIFETRVIQGISHSNLALAVAGNDISTGLENLHILTQHKNAKLRIDVEQKEPTLIPGLSPKGFALYDRFWIGDASTDYVLDEISGYSGQYSVGMRDRGLLHGYRVITRLHFTMREEGHYCIISYHLLQFTHQWALYEGSVRSMNHLPRC